MDFYSMEQFEIVGDAMEEVAEWEAYERDMATDPYEEMALTDEQLDALFNYWEECRENEKMTWQDHLWE